MEMSRHILTKIDFLSLIIDTYIDRCKLFYYTNSGMLWFLYGSKCWGFAPGCFPKEGDMQRCWALTDGH